MAVHVPFFTDRLGTTKIRTAEGSLNGWRNCDVIYMYVHAAILDYNVAMNCRQCSLHVDGADTKIKTMIISSKGNSMKICTNENFPAVQMPCNPTMTSSQSDLHLHVQHLKFRTPGGGGGVIILMKENT